jgi:hypothetical protein
MFLAVGTLPIMHASIQLLYLAPPEDFPFTTRQEQLGLTKSKKKKKEDDAAAAAAASPPKKKTKTTDPMTNPKYPRFTEYVIAPSWAKNQIGLKLRDTKQQVEVGSEMGHLLKHTVTDVSHTTIS